MTKAELILLCLYLSPISGRIKLVAGVICHLLTKLTARSRSRSSLLLSLVLNEYLTAAPLNVGGWGGGTYCGDEPVVVFTGLSLSFTIAQIKVLWRSTNFSSLASCIFLKWLSGGEIFATSPSGAPLTSWHGQCSPTRFCRVLRVVYSNFTCFNCIHFTFLQVG